MRTLALTGQPPRFKVHLAVSGVYLWVWSFRIAASSVNLEFRDIDKFVASLGGSVVIVTDSWILQTNVHGVDIIHQRDAVLQ